MTLRDYIMNDRDVARTNQMIQDAKSLADHWTNSNITMSLMRGIFGHIRRIQSVERSARTWTEVRLLEPRIVYKIRRKIGNMNQADDLSRELVQAVQAVNGDEAKLERFGEAVETIIAYMKKN